MHRLVAAIVVAGAAASCTVDAAEPSLAPVEPTPAPTSVATTSPPPASTTTAPIHDTTQVPDAADPVDEGSTALPDAAEPIDVCQNGPEQLDVGAESPPDTLLDRLAFVLASPKWADVDRSVSVWIEGYGEVLAVEADDRLLPASNQKIFTAIGASLLLDPDHAFETSVHVAGDDLVLVAGGDPTLARVGDHSLQELARQVKSAGIDEIDQVFVDTSHFESDIAAPGWLDYQMPAYVGPMSALMVDDNRYRLDVAFINEPAVSNGQLFAFLLGEQGVSVAGSVVSGLAGDDAVAIASVRSEPVRELVADMMTVSDNEVAESLLREIGDGFTTAGVARVDEALAGWCLDLQGESGDGSGLGRASFRSSREWRRLLQVIGEQPWADEFRATLAVAGRTGTLADRFVGTAAHGVVQAKTGSIIGGRSLSGYTTTADGREVVFSVVTNGTAESARVSRDAIDGLVISLVTPMPIR